MLPMNLTTQMFPMNLTTQIPLGTLITQMPSMDFVPIIPVNRTDSPEPQMSSRAPKSPKSRKTPRRVPMATPDVKGYKTNVPCVQPDLDRLNKIYEMVCEEKSTNSNCDICCDPEKTMTHNDVISSYSTFYEEPQHITKRHRQKDKVTEELSEHQEELQDTKTSTVKRRKKKDKTPCVFFQTEEEVLKFSPRRQKGTGRTCEDLLSAERPFDYLYSCNCDTRRLLQDYPSLLCCDTLRSPKSHLQSTGTARDCVLRYKTLSLYEKPLCFTDIYSRGAATCTEDKVTEKLSKHQEESAKPQDTETPTVKERKKRDETRSESPQSEEEVPKSSPGGEEQRGSCSSSQGDAKPESESSWWRWERVIMFFPKTLDFLRRLGAAITAVRKTVVFSAKIVCLVCAVCAIFGLGWFLIRP